MEIDMVFLISLGLALLLTLPFRDKIIKYHNVIYVVAVLFAATAVFVSWRAVVLPGFVNSYVVPVLARGGLAGALFVIVMVTGALPNGSYPMRRLMPIRGHLSIIACILTIGHNISYGKIYFVRLFTGASNMPLWQMAAAVCSLAMILIMLPLFITSFPVVRKRMAAKKWKRLQRLAYVFYGLMYCHVVLLNCSRAMGKNISAMFTVWVYTMVFGGYLACRMIKALFMLRVAQSRSVGNGELRGRITGRSVKRQGEYAVSNGKWQASEHDLPYWQCMAGATWLVLATIICCVIFIIQPYAGGSVVASQEATVKASQADLQNSKYSDGTYTGSAMGMNGIINVSVRLEGGRIADVTIESHKDDEEYFDSAVSVVDEIIGGNSTEVDTISGATYSSGGIIDAVKNALAKASGE
jgi:DMSO/TMAO reductase YedYZ heme-binding membrane subunit/uncharacterized protein with FMN-binding domain